MYKVTFEFVDVILKCGVTHMKGKYLGCSFLTVFLFTFQLIFFKTKFDLTQCNGHSGDVCFGEKVE